MEDGMPKEAIREIESQELFSEDGEAEKYIVRIKEVFVGKTSLNLVYYPFCKFGDLYDFMKRSPCLTYDQAWAMTY